MLRLEFISQVIMFARGSVLLLIIQSYLQIDGQGFVITPFVRISMMNKIIPI